MGYMDGFLAKQKRPAVKGKIQSSPGKREDESEIGKRRYASGDAKEEVRGHVTEHREAGHGHIGAATVPALDEDRAPEEDLMPGEVNEDDKAVSRALMGAQDEAEHARALRAAVKHHMASMR